MRVHFGDAEALQSFLIIFAIKNVPLFAAFQNLFLLRRDLRAHFRVHLLFHFQQRRENRYDFLADRVAISTKSTSGRVTRRSMMR